MFWTIDTLAGYLGLPREEVDHVSAGVNHLAFLLRLEHRGRDLYPDLREFVAAGRVPDDDLVRAELFRRLGFYPTESSEHHAEYNPWFIPKGDAVERYHIPIGEYLDRVAHNLEEYAETEAAPGRRRAVRDRAERRVRGGHRPLAADRRAGAHRGQRPNHGALISNLVGRRVRRGARLVDGTGVWPVAVGALPPQCAAYIGPAVDTQALTVRAALRRGSREAVYHAVMQDPQVQARSTSTRPGA